jgi:hypothetical protein
VQPNNDLAHPTSWGGSAAAGPATSRGGFQPPKWLRFWQPSAASATRLAEAASSRHQPFQWHKPLKSTEGQLLLIIASFLETRCGFERRSRCLHCLPWRARPGSGVKCPPRAGASPLPELKIDSNLSCYDHRRKPS